MKVSPLYKTTLTPFLSGLRGSPLSVHRQESGVTVWFSEPRDVVFII